MYVIVVKAMFHGMTNLMPEIPEAGVQLPESRTMLRVCVCTDIANINISTQADV